MARASALIALGGNLPLADLTVAETLQNAIQVLQDRLGTAPQQSRMFRNPAYPAGSGPDYTNAAVRVTCPYGLTAANLLAILHQIEADHGRQRQARWAGRTLDMDLLALGDLILPDAATQALWRNLPAAEQGASAPDQLILPHPRLQDRAFVLVPLADIAPDWCHPVLGLTVTEMLRALPRDQVDSVIAL